MQVFLLSISHVNPKTLNSSNTMKRERVTERERERERENKMLLTQHDDHKNAAFASSVLFLQPLPLYLSGIQLNSFLTPFLKKLEKDLVQLIYFYFPFSFIAVILT